jgi:hypothetical protein
MEGIVINEKGEKFVILSNTHNQFILQKLVPENAFDIYYAFYDLRSKYKTISEIRESKINIINE